MGSFRKQDKVTTPRPRLDTSFQIHFLTGPALISLPTSKIHALSSFLSFIFGHVTQPKGFNGGLDGQESARNVGDLGSVPG